MATKPLTQICLVYIGELAHRFPEEDVAALPVTILGRLLPYLSAAQLHRLNSVFMKAGISTVATWRRHLHQRWPHTHHRYSSVLGEGSTLDPHRRYLEKHFHELLRHAHFGQHTDPSCVLDMCLHHMISLRFPVREPSAAVVDTPLQCQLISFALFVRRLSITALQCCHLVQSHDLMRLLCRSVEMLDLHLAQDRYYHNMRAFLLALMVDGKLKHLALYNMRLSPRYMKDLLNVCAGRFSNTASPAATGGLVPSPPRHQGLLAPSAFSPDQSSSVSPRVDCKNQPTTSAVENEFSPQVRPEFERDDLSRKNYLLSDEDGSDTEETAEAELDLYDAALLAPTSGSSQNLMYRCNRFHARPLGGVRHRWPQTHPALDRRPPTVPATFFRKRPASATSATFSLSGEPKTKLPKPDLKLQLVVEAASCKSEEGSTISKDQHGTSGSETPERSSTPAGQEGKSNTGGQEGRSSPGGQEGRSDSGGQERRSGTTGQEESSNPDGQEGKSDTGGPEEIPNTGGQPSACQKDSKCTPPSSSTTLTAGTSSSPQHTMSCDEVWKFSSSSRETVASHKDTGTPSSRHQIDITCSSGGGEAAETTPQVLDIHRQVSEAENICDDNKIVSESDERQKEAVEGAALADAAISLGDIFSGQLQQPGVIVSSPTPESSNEVEVATPDSTSCQTEAGNTCSGIKADVGRSLTLFTSRLPRELLAEPQTEQPESGASLGAASLAVIDCNGTTLGTYLAAILPTWSSLKNLTLTFTGIRSGPLTEVLLSRLRSGQLTSLVLEDTYLCDGILHFLTLALTVPRTTPLKLIKLSNNMQELCIREGHSSDINGSFVGTENLDLSYNTFMASGIQHLQLLLRYDTALRHLKLEGCHFSANEVITLLHALQGSGLLESLSLAENLLAADAQQEVIRTINALPRLTCLNLNTCLLAPHIVISDALISALLNHPRLERLTLATNRLGGAGCHLLRRVLEGCHGNGNEASQTCPLRWLDLGYNCIPFGSLLATAQSVTPSRPLLAGLILSGNLVTPHQRTVILNAFTPLATQVVADTLDFSVPLAEQICQM